MSKVIEMLDSLGVAEDGISTVYPDTFVDDIRGAYAADFDIPSSKILVLESELAKAQEEILLLKAHNYELIVSAPATDPDEEEEEEEPEGEMNDEDQGVSGLFKNKEN